MRNVLFLTLSLGWYLPGTVAGQNQTFAPEKGSANVKVLSHIPLGWQYTIADIEIEQELSRPYAYVQRDFGEAGFQIISLKDPTQAKVIYSWKIEQPELHTGRGGSDGHYFKLNGRYYYVQSFHFGQDGKDADVGAIVFDVTSLPDTSRVREVGRLRAKDAPGGFHTLFPYKHSDGRVLLFVTSRGGARIFDMARFLANSDTTQGYVGVVPGHEVNGRRGGYHDYYLAYDAKTRQDKFYGAGGTYFTVFDVSKPEEPRQLSGIYNPNYSLAHTFSATPDGRYAVAQTEFEPSPVRIFDLKQGGDTNVSNPGRTIGAWQGSWHLGSHNHEIRWPYLFVASFEDGLHIVNMMDPTNPYTVGYYNTRFGSDFSGVNLRTGLKAGDPAQDGGTIFNGAWGVDIRNADGLIVVSDFKTGFWAFKMEGFDGWNGHQWGVPNISSAQDWDNGPDGAPRPQRVS
jgi:hypothetical protein